MRYLLIRNIRLPNLPPTQRPVSLLTCGGRIVGMGTDMQYPLTDTTNIDADGCYVLPALMDFCRVPPPGLDAVAIGNLNFENAAAGVVSVLTVARDVDENIADFKSIKVPLLNYAYHFPLRQLTEGRAKELRHKMLHHGIATAAVRFADDAKDDVGTFAPNVAVARWLGVRVLYDFRGVAGRVERLAKLKCLAEILRADRANMAYVVGVETRDELGVLEELRDRCDVAAHICYDPLSIAAGAAPRFRPEEIAQVLRREAWCSLGLAFGVGGAMRQAWPDTTREILFRNKLPLLCAMPLGSPLLLSELVEFAMRRPAAFVGLHPPLGEVAPGRSANLIVWNPDAADNFSVGVPAEVRLTGRVEYVIMNGEVVVGKKFIPEKVHGEHLYARIV